MRAMSRRQIHFVLFVLIINIGVTIFYSSIENPTINTFSMTGNRYDDINNIHFIVWATVFSLTSFYLLREIIKHHDEKPAGKIRLLLHNSILLVVITLIPARTELSLLRWIHIVLSGVYAIILTSLIHPYIRRVFENKVIRIPILVWLVCIWGGAIAFYFSYGHNSIYQIWFFINLPIFLSVLYLYQNIKVARRSEDHGGNWKFENRSIYLVLMLLLNILVTLIYGNIENPLLYTLSMIANLHNPIYYILFLVWGLVYSISTYFVIVALYKETDFDDHKNIWIILVSVLTLILTVLVPANPSYKVLHYIHMSLSVLYVLIFTYGLHGFIIHVTKEFNKIKIAYFAWVLFTWVGAIIIYFYYGNTGIYEMWFFVNIPLILISLVVFVNYKKTIKVNNI